MTTVFRCQSLTDACSGVCTQNLNYQMFPLPPLYSIIPFFFSISSPSLIHIPKPHEYQAAQLLPLKMYLAELTRNWKQVTVTFNGTVKEVCRSAWVKWIWELVNIDTDAGDGVYRWNSLISISLDRLAHILAHLKISKCTWKKEKRKNPKLFLTKWESKMHQTYFGMFFSTFALGQHTSTNYGLSFFPSVTPNWEIYFDALRSRAH